MRPMALIRALLAVLLICAGGAPGWGQDSSHLSGTRTLTPVPANKAPGVELKVEVNPRVAKLGDVVEVCFSAASSGYVTLWNIGAEDDVQRIFPNALQPIDAGAMQINGGQRYCAGKQGDAFRFRVDPPAGTDTLYAVWTAAPDAQLKPASYRTTAAFASDLERLRSVGADRWATNKTFFEILDPARPNSGAPPTPVGQGGLAPAPLSAPSTQVAPIPPAVPPPAAIEAASPPPPRPSPQGGDMGALVDALSGRPQSAQRPSAPAAPPQQPSQPAPSMLDGDAPRIVLLSMGANVSPLKKTNQDASVFASTMKQMFSIPDSNIRLIHNVYKAQFREGINWMKTKLRPQDLAVVYFSGHGAHVEDPSGTSADGFDEAFVPYDMETNGRPSARDLVWSQEYARWINGLPTNNVITVVDACHSAGLTRGLDSDTIGAVAKAYTLPAGTDLTPPEELLNQPRTRAAVGSGRIQAKGLLLAAARREQTALEVSRGGLFTVALLDYMARTRNGNLNSAFEAASRDVSNVTKGRQVPEAVGGRAVAERVLIGR